MNPYDWADAAQRLHGGQHPHQHPAINNITDRTNDDWDTYCQYSRYTVNEPQSSMGVNLAPPMYDPYSKEPEVEDPDGEPFEAVEEEDPELVRKRNELKEIEERIMRKRVSIALKNVELVKETPPPSASCKGAALKDRVNAILQQRHPISFLSKPPKDRLNSTSRSKDGLLQEHHPLKLRVKALMKQRCILPTNGEVPDVTPPPPSRSVTSPAGEQNSINQGFQRFLSVLNKGVDMDLLSRIVNDDSEDLPVGQELLSIQPVAVENKSDPPLRVESQRPVPGASGLGHGRTHSGERRTDPSSQERSSKERLSLPDDGEKKNDRGDLCFGSSSGHKSPPQMKKKKEGEEENPKVDEQRAQLQNILNTLGLSLEVDEMSRLADRTQERLYGKKHDASKADSKGEQEGRQRASHRQHRNSSSSSSSSPSSSSSSASSRSTSRSASPRPSRRRRSGSGDSKRRRTSERSGSGDRSREWPTHGNGSQDSKDGGGDGKDPTETSAYQQPFPQNQIYPHPHSAAFPAFPDGSLSHYSEYDAYNSGSYGDATDSYWTYNQGAVPPHLYPSEHPCPQNSYHDFPGSALIRCKTLDDTDLFVNPDLSKSEGQTGATSGPRCLQVISTKPAPQSFIKQLTKGRKRKGNIETRRKKRRLHDRKKKEQKRAAKQKAAAAAREAEARQRKQVEVKDGGGGGAVSEPEQSEEEKRQPTEEEIKANLRKKLEAFNQKAKQRLSQPANSLLSHTG